MKPKTAVVVGAGDRGMRAYAPYALDHPHELKIVGVAEPNSIRREKFQEQHGLSDKQCHSDWETLLTNNPADIAIICTMDRAHFEPTMQALKKGYHVLLEKPMSPDPSECIQMNEAAHKYNRKLSICHVLRYTDFWSTIKEVVDDGTIGDIASLQLNENVEIMHMAHSFVRGNWNNKEKSSPMILQKSCHDMDIINYILDKSCERISSYGSLFYFNQEHKPEGAPKKCLDGCPVARDCPFHAGRYYLGEGRGWARKFTEDDSKEGIVQALNDTPYGNCVFQSDNNVVDHQVVNMEFTGGVTATFSMCGFTREQTRQVQIMGTKGEIRGKMDENSISIYDFLTQQETVIHLPTTISGHGGGDFGIIQSFLDDIQDEQSISRSSSDQSLESHLMAFVAETSRLNQGESIELADFFESLKV